MSQVASPAMPPSPTVTPFPYTTLFRSPRQDGFDIVVASEIMAILCLATDLADLERRIGAIVVGFTYDRSPVSVADLGVAGAITDRKSTRLNSSHVAMSYAVICWKKKKHIGE